MNNTKGVVQKSGRVDIEWTEQGNVQVMCPDCKEHFKTTVFALIAGEGFGECECGYTWDAWIEVQGEKKVEVDKDSKQIERGFNSTSF